MGITVTSRISCVERTAPANDARNTAFVHVWRGLSQEWRPPDRPNLGTVRWAAEILGDANAPHRHDRGEAPTVWSSGPGRVRTCDLRVMSSPLLPLSYGPL